MKKLLNPISCFLTFFFVAEAFAVDRNLKPPNDDSVQVASVYQDMVVIQRKAKLKAEKFLFSSYAAYEFSDGPKAIASLNLDFGYAFSDDFELYLNVAPVFVTQNRKVASQVAELELANGQKAQLLSPDPKIQFGVQALWSPAYGKDSWGPFSIVRSDTFFKAYLGMTQFSSGSGFRGSVGVGKTFFLSPNFNPRISGSFAFQESIVNEQKSMTQAGIFEFGLVWYL